MGPWSRPDARSIPGLSPLRRFMPALLPQRNGAVVYFEQIVPVQALQAFIDARNAERPADAPPIKLFAVLVTALAHTLTLRPTLNRYVAGGKLWQRDAISVGYVVKKAMADSAKMTTVRMTLPEPPTLDAVTALMAAQQRIGRGDAPLTSEKEMAVVTRLPMPLLRGLMALQRLLDGWGLLPAMMTRDDPLYASVMCANLGSVGLDAGFHHLFEYGTTPLFLTIGRVHRAPIVDDAGAVVAADVVKLCWSYDERIADGFYAARSLETFSALLREPERLLRAPEPGPGHEARG